MLGITNLNGVVAGKYIPPEPIIPDNYEILEYVVVPEGAYMDSGLLSTANRGFEIEFYTMKTKGGFFPIGVYDAGNPSSYFHIVSSVTDNKYRLYFGAEYNTNLLAVAEVKLLLSTNYLGTKEYRINDTVTPITTNLSAPSTRPIYIGAANNSSALSTYKFNGGIYKTNISDGPDIIFKGVPVRDKDTDICGLYDIITKSLKSSITGIKLTPGPVKVI